MNSTNRRMTSILARREPKEVAELKRQWISDPIWDIEDTEGFEAHREELAVWQSQIEEEWRRERIKRHWERAEKWGCTPALVRYIEYLEGRIEELEDNP